MTADLSVGFITTLGIELSPFLGFDAAFGAGTLAEGTLAEGTLAEGTLAAGALAAGALVAGALAAGALAAGALLAFAAGVKTTGFLFFVAFALAEASFLAAFGLVAFVTLIGALTTGFFGEGLEEDMEWKVAWIEKLDYTPPILGAQREIAGGRNQKVEW